MSAPELSPGDELANDLEARRRRARILAEVEAVQPSGFDYATAVSRATGAMDAVFHALGIAGATPRPTLIKAASLVLSAIEAIDKENGR